jgi:hypothetical protein
MDKGTGQGTGGGHGRGPTRQMWPLVMVYFLLVVVLRPVLAGWLGQGYADMVVFGIIALLSLSFIREALSAASYARIAGSHPELKRGGWISMVLMQDVVIPLAAAALFTYLL